MQKQAPMPDWLKIRIRLKPEQLKQFRKFLRLIHKIEKKHGPVAQRSRAVG